MESFGNYFMRVFINPLEPYARIGGNKLGQTCGPSAFASSVAGIRVYSLHVAMQLFLFTKFDNSTWKFKKIYSAKN